MMEVAFPREDKEARSADVDKDAEYSTLYDEFLSGPIVFASENTEGDALLQERMVSFEPDDDSEGTFYTPA